MNLRYRVNSQLFLGPSSLYVLRVNAPELRGCISLMATLLAQVFEQHPILICRAEFGAFNLIVVLLALTACPISRTLLRATVSTVENVLASLSWEYVSLHVFWRRCWHKPLHCKSSKPASKYHYYWITLFPGARLYRLRTLFEQSPFDATAPTCGLAIRHDGQTRIYHPASPTHCVTLHRCLCTPLHSSCRWKGCLCTELYEMLRYCDMAISCDSQ